MDESDKPIDDAELVEFELDEFFERHESVPFHSGTYAVGTEEQLEDFIAKRTGSNPVDRSPGQPGTPFSFGRGTGCRNIRSTRGL